MSCKWVMKESSEKREGWTESSSFVSDRQSMSISWRTVKWESSPSRQRDVIELMFTCEMEILLVCSCGSPKLVFADEGEDKVPTAAARGPELGEQGVDSMLSTGPNGAAVCEFSSKSTIACSKKKKINGSATKSSKKSACKSKRSLCN